MPDTETVALKKSKILLLSIRLPELGLAAVPKPITALVGRLAPAGPRSQNETVLLLFPAPEVVLKRMFPPAVATAAVDDPSTEHLVTTLFCAPLMKRMVLAPAVAEAVVLETVSELPPVPIPSMATLVAPFKSINGLPAAIAPETVRAPPPEGSIRIEV
jgi:hypothetical protein